MESITDIQIREYVTEEKVLPQDFKPSFHDKNNQNYYEKEILGKSGNTFKIIIRQSQINALDFSVIFGVMINGTLFRLKRYNGDSHEHTNVIEEENLEGFHIHSASERYQKRGFREEGYAEKTTKYSDWQSALKVMIKENNFEVEIAKEQKRLK